MLKYYDGTVFNTDAEWIVNTVNCVGVMGAGLALEFKLRYPEMFADYQEKCAKELVKVGEMQYYDDSRILNFPTKAHFKYPSQIAWIEEGLKQFVATYKDHDVKSIAFSKLGCGKGGLNWDLVKPLMEQYLSDIDADVTICLDSEVEAKGKELEMVNAFNVSKLSDFNDAIRLTSAQKALLENLKPIRRFSDLNRVTGIGSTTYEHLFMYFYKAEDAEGQQISLF